MPRVPRFVESIVGDVSVSYSGGLDSTSVALWAITGGNIKAHLHTLDHGYGYPFNSWASRTAKSLARSVGEDKVFHHFIKTKDLFDRVAMGSLVADRKKYGQWFGCCLGCTLAIITKIILYNLENGVPHICLGSSVGGEYAVMSKPVSVAHFKKFAEGFGIHYLAPLLEDNVVKSEERQALKDAGVFSGYRFLDKHSFGNQGYCLLSLQHLPDVLINIHPDYDPEAVDRFINDKLPICHDYIAERYRQTGRSLEEDVARIKDQFDRPRNPNT